MIHRSIVSKLLEKRRNEYARWISTSVADTKQLSTDTTKTTSSITKRTTATKEEEKGQFDIDDNDEQHRKIMARIEKIYS